MDARDIILTVAFTLAGGVAGWAYCFLVRYSLAYLNSDKKQVAKFVALMLARVALVGGGFFGALHVGTWPVIGYTAGFFIARTMVVSRAQAQTVGPGGSEDIGRTDG